MNKRFRSIRWNQTRITSNLDFTSPGKQFGELRLKYSDNDTALGYLPIPAGVIANDTGPTVLLIGGVHGDEFEGPVALLKLLHELNCEDVHGRIIVFPALNSPALNASARVSPIDEGNLNRSFPGNPDSTPTPMIADFIENAVMPVCDAVVDIHSGGRAAWFAPCSMAMQYDDAELSKKNLQIAITFGTPFVWLMGKLNDDRSVNYAAVRNNVPMIAVELGGGGQVSPEMLAIGSRGIRNILHSLGVLHEPFELSNTPPVFLEIREVGQHIYSPTRGLFEPAFTPGNSVTAGQTLGFVYDLDEIGNPPTEIKFPMDGVAFVRCHRGVVKRGELLSLLGVVCQPEYFSE